MVFVIIFDNYRICWMIQIHENKHGHRMASCKIVGRQPAKLLENVPENGLENKGNQEIKTLVDKRYVAFEPACAKSRYG